MSAHQDLYYTKEKPSKISNITFAILLFYHVYQKKISGHPASTLESTTFDETIL